MQAHDLLITTESIHSADAATLLDALSASLKEITGNSGIGSFDVTDMDHPRSCFAVARDVTGALLGCGAIRPLSDSSAEMKRVFASRSGHGIGRAIVQYLEEQANLLGYETIVLETRKINHHAVSFYLSNGYEIIPNYGKYAGREDAVCFEKKLKSLSVNQQLEDTKR